MRLLAGKLLAVEGIDQAGKQTVCNWLVDELRREDVRTELIGFPDYDTELGAEINRFLQSGRRYPLQVRQMLYAANRWERAAEIRSWLEDGRAVVVDRYSGSNVAYGAAQGLDIAWILAIESGLPLPDMTLVLDIPPEVSLARKPYGRDEYEARLDLLAAVREVYRKLADRFGWHVIDANADRETVRERVRAALTNHINAM